MIKYKNLIYYTDFEEFQEEYKITDTKQTTYFEKNGFLVIHKHKDYQTWCSCDNIGEEIKGPDCLLCREMFLREKKLERICNGS
jgi:hypothetical protein